ncbi:D-aminoacyl-tRNA deacylase-like [Asterias rubens]|uniref:D-aminoacyl-tRNA deacylase-like n=1 Tax=Asterias rubens TaxID=7604 RepID=UPI0014552BB1|nr:D-aminoacyl-tRNA deacylase-like [Asterias rubens]
MRALVQRVTKASVTVGDELISSIGKGLCVLVGISRDDTPKDREYIARKLLNLRVFEDEKEERRWDKSVKDKQLEILCVSQFTLYSILKGNKPDFHSAMAGDQSEQFYQDFLAILKKDFKPELIKDGKFGAHMQVHIQNDGPVTIMLESPAENNKQGAKQPMTPVPRTPRQSGSKAPVAIVKGQQQDKVKERASRYISSLTTAFEGQVDVHKDFLSTITNYRDNQVSATEMMLKVGTLFIGHTQLICSFTGILPTNHSLSIVNNDPNMVSVHIPGQRSMSLDEVRQFLETNQVSEVCKIST